MPVEEIFWPSDGLKIRGEFYPPVGEKRPFPGLIICHGIPAKVKGPDDQGYPALARRFSQERFGVLIFNFRGAGLSEGNFDIRGWARDLEGALGFLTHRPEVDIRRIYVMGFSGGAAVAIYVAARRQEITGVVCCASPADLHDLLTEKGLENFLAHSREVGIIKDASFPPDLQEWKQSFLEVQPSAWIKRIPPRPILLIHGTQDDVVPVHHAQDLNEQVKGKAEFFLLEGAGHRLRVEEQAMRKAEEWLKRKAFSSQPSAGS